MPLLDDNLAFWIRNEALQQIQSNLPAYEASRVNLVFDDDVYDDINFIALNPGEGYGLLRSLEPDDRPHSRDVVIYETLPNELPRVAGIISTVPQTPLSHVNLRALQDDIPNAFIAHALEDDAISDLIGSYVHYAVSDTGYSIRAATQAEVNGHYASSRRSEAQTPVRDLSATSVTPLSNIGFDDWDSFGVKAANVAVLRTLGFPQGTVPDGFAVPFYFYDEFMKHNNLYDDIEEMLADPDFQSDYDTKVSKLKKLRKKIKKADTPEWIETALTAMHASFPEGTSLRYRSSTNNEDLPGFNGAGLYDSKTQHPEETAEDGISKSLKQVYASLWNFRAFIERDFHGIDHMKTAMGVLVHPNYSDERVNGVAVSVDPAYNTEGTHYVNSQLGEDLVTNPEARSVPEEVLLYPDGTYSVVALSNQVPDGRLLMTEDQLVQLRRHLAATHTKFLELYGVEQGERFAMEIEFKITSANVLSIKQARPWIFSGPSPEIDPIPSEDPGVALTASFKSVPATHDGSPFDVRFQFSERLSISRESFKNHAVTVTGGSVTNARMARFRVDRWLVTVSPDSPMADVTVVMPHNRPCTVNGAICTFGGRRLSNRLEYTVEGLVPRVPDRPTGRDLSPGVVALEWNDVPRADSYEVQFQQNGRWIDLPANGAEIELDGAGAVVKGLPAASTFNFRVRGVNSYGASEWSPRLIIRTRVDWEGELTAGQSTDVSPIKSGYSIYGSLGWALSPDEFVHEGTTYTVEFLVYAGESLWLGVDPELPADFSLRVGELTYLGSESKALHTVSGAGGYWWPSVAPDWFGDPVQVGLIVYAGVPLADRQKAPVTAEFRKFPAEHDGQQDVSFRIYFSEGVDTTADALRDYVLSVSGGTVSSVEAVGDESRIWAVSITPDSLDPVRIDIATDLNCALPEAVCAADGRRLFNRMALTVEPMEHHPATGAPTIVGTVEVGETLTVDTSGISDADGMTGATFSYQWVSYDGRAYTEIQGATDSTYTLVPADEGKAFRVRVSFTDDIGLRESLASALTHSERPYALATTESDGTVALTWRVPVGVTNWAVFQILRNRPELGETEPLVHVEYTQGGGTSYTDTDVEPGVLYVYRVKGADFFGIVGEASDPASVRVPGSNSAATGAPTISGTVQVGETLTADTSGISDHDGMDNATFSFQWLAADSEIHGATGSTFTLTDTQEGKAIRVRVSFTDDAGNDESLTSAATGAVEARPNSPATGVPSITGTPELGETLTAETSGIADENGTNDATFTYQWLRAETEISGATGSTYTVVLADAQRDIKVRVSFTDDDGFDESVTSASVHVPQHTPLTAEFKNYPSSHTGSSTFNMQVQFNYDIKIGWQAFQDDSFTISGGDITHATRVNKQRDLWQITVRPDGDEDVTISLAPNRVCTTSGAICNSHGMMLSNEPTATIAGP